MLLNNFETKYEINIQIKNARRAILQPQRAPLTQRNHPPGEHSRPSGWLISAIPGQWHSRISRSWKYLITDVCGGYLWQTWKKEPLTAKQHCGAVQLFASSSVVMIPSLSGAFWHGTLLTNDMFPACLKWLCCSQMKKWISPTKKDTVTVTGNKTE